MNKNVNVKIRYNSKQEILNKEIPPVKIVKFIDKKSVLFDFDRKRGSWHITESTELLI